MWRPRTWSDVVALIGHAEETASLEFKREMTSNSREIAKDIAAMTIDGGVLLYGIEEDNTRASRIVPTPIQNLERIQLLAQSNIRPSPAIEVVAIKENPSDSSGVIAVVVPASPLAPHEVHHRFPRRDGTTTTYLTEPEIERLYRLRRHASPAPRCTDLLSIASDLPGIDGVQATSTQPGYGFVRVACRIEGDARHPADPWMEQALSYALWRATERMHDSTILLSELGADPWEPLDVRGWVAGRTGDYEAMTRAPTGAGVFHYPAHLLTQVTLPLTGEHSGGLERLPYNCAYEQWVMREVIAGIVLAGVWAEGYPTAGRLFVSAQLAGFSGSFSYRSTRAHPRVDVSGLRAAPGSILALLPSSALELRQRPGETARRLIDRWLVPFYDGPDLAQSFVIDQ